MRLTIANTELTELPSTDFPQPLPKYAGRVELDLNEFHQRPKVKGLTIDGEHSRDLDDAIWLEKNSLGYQVTVSIADVDALVKPYSYLDFEALHRTTSIYFPGKSIPMFPAILSGFQLSLLPEVERPTLSVIIQLSDDYRVLSTDIAKTRLKSKCRLNYEQISPHLSLSKGISFSDYTNVARALQFIRSQKQEFVFGQTQNGISLDEDGHAQSKKTTDGHMIVQEFMILANQVVANFFNRYQVAIPFRNHTLVNGTFPKKQQIIDLVESAEDYSQITDSLGRLFHDYFNSASYQPKSSGHCGLGVQSYTHFTSPIRRYSDLIVHRQIKAILEGRELVYNSQEIDQLCHYINSRLRRIASLRNGHPSQNSFLVYRESKMDDSTAESLNLPEIDGMQKLRGLLQENKLGNPRFEFSMEQGITPVLKCTAWIKVNNQKIEASFAERATKSSVRSLAANKLYKALLKLLAIAPQQMPIVESASAAAPRNSQELNRPAETTDPVLILSRWSDEQELKKPVYTYEIWHGSKKVSCTCYISETLCVTGVGETMQEAKSNAAIKLLSEFSKPVQSNTVVDHTSAQIEAVMQPSHL